MLVEIAKMVSTMTMLMTMMWAVEVGASSEAYVEAPRMQHVGNS